MVWALLVREVLCISQCFCTASRGDPATRRDLGDGLYSPPHPLLSFGFFVVFCCVFFLFLFFVFLNKTKQKAKLAEVLKYFILVSNVNSYMVISVPGTFRLHVTFVIFLWITKRFFSSRVS